MRVQLRGLKKGDKQAIEEMLARIDEFSLEDRILAMELIHITLDQPNQKDYVILVAESENQQVAGFACYGPTPLTDGTYDLYWIGVDPKWAGNGIGTHLLKTIEERIQSSGGRLLVIETSSATIYEKTRRFYLKNGYHLEETLHDFYQDGEDRVTYVKRLLS